MFEQLKAKLFPVTKIKAKTRRNSKKYKMAIENVSEMFDMIKESLPEQNGKLTSEQIKFVQTLKDLIKSREYYFGETQKLDKQLVTQQEQIETLTTQLAQQEQKVKNLKNINERQAMVNHSQDKEIKRLARQVQNYKYRRHHSQFSS